MPLNQRIDQQGTERCMACFDILLGGGGAYRIFRWVVSSRYCVFGINNTLSPLLRLYRDFHVKQILRHTAISSVYIYIFFILLIKIINGRIAFLHPNPHIYQVLTLLSTFR